MIFFTIEHPKHLGSGTITNDFAWAQSSRRCFCTEQAPENIGHKWHKTWPRDKLSTTRNDGDNVPCVTLIWYRNYFISAKMFLVWSFQDDLDIFACCLNYLGTYTTEVVVQSYLMSELILDDYIWGLCTFMHCSCVSSPCIGVIMLYASILFYIHTHVYIYTIIYVSIHP